MKFPQKIFCPDTPLSALRPGDFFRWLASLARAQKRNWNISRSFYSYALKFSAFIPLNEIFQMRPFSHPGEFSKSRFRIFIFLGLIFIGRKKIRLGEFLQKRNIFQCLMTWMIKKCKDIFGTKLLWREIIFSKSWIFASYFFLNFCTNENELHYTCIYFCWWI